MNSTTNTNKNCAISLPSPRFNRLMKSCIHALLLFLLIYITAPPIIRAQGIPPVPEPIVVMVQCHHCKEWIDTPGGQIPATCPFCGYPLSPKTPPHESDPAPEAPLFYDQPARPPVQTNAHDRAEALHRALREAEALALSNRLARTRQFELQKQALITPPAGSGKSPLKNLFATDPNVVDLSSATSFTPDLLRSNKTTALPPNTLSAISDERLEKKRRVLTETIARLQKIQEENVRAYMELSQRAETGKAAAQQAALDAGTTLSFGILDHLAPNEKTKALVDAAQHGVTGLNLTTTLDDVWEDETKTKEALVETTMAIGDLTVKSKRLGMLPGLTKLSFDTSLIWMDYAFQSEELEQREQLRKQNDASLHRLSADLKNVIAEQQRRAKAAQKTEP